MPCAPLSPQRSFVQGVGLVRTRSGVDDACLFDSINSQIVAISCEEPRDQFRSMMKSEFLEPQLFVVVYEVCGCLLNEFVEYQFPSPTNESHVQQGTKFTVEKRIICAIMIEVEDKAQ